MTDDQLIEQLRQSLAAHAASVSLPDDAWDTFQRPESPTLAVATRGPRPRWLLPAAAGVAVAVAAAALLFVAPSPRSTSSRLDVAAPPSLGARPAAPPGPADGSSGSPAPGETTAVALGGPPGGSVPAGFSPVSATFVSARTGWVLGQAPCASPPCTSVVRTSDGGQTWVGIPAPRTELSDLSVASDAPGVRLIRFANLNDGWAFGTELWVTHDGGAHWKKMALPGATPGSPIMDLEAAAGLVHAAVVGSGGAIRVDTSPVSSDQWTTSSAVVPIGGGPDPSVQILLQGQAGWLIENDRTVVGGVRLDQRQWVPWQPPCLSVGGPAVLSASSASNLVAVCEEGLWSGGTTPVERAYTSRDGGFTFQATGSPPATGDAGPPLVASPSPQTIVIGLSSPGSAGSGVLVASFDGGATWAGVARRDATWHELGFTTSTQGVVVAAQASPRGATMLMTYDGGHTWNPVAFRQAS